MNSSSARGGLQCHSLLRILMAQAVDHHGPGAQAGGSLDPDGKGIARLYPVAPDAHRPDGDDLRQRRIQAGGLEVQRHPLVASRAGKEQGKLPSRNVLPSQRRRQCIHIAIA